MTAKAAADIYGKVVRSQINAQPDNPAEWSLHLSLLMAVCTSPAGCKIQNGYLTFLDVDGNPIACCDHYWVVYNSKDFDPGSGAACELMPQINRRPFGGLRRSLAPPDDQIPICRSASVAERYDLITEAGYRAYWDEHATDADKVLQRQITGGKYRAPKAIQSPAGPLAFTIMPIFPQMPKRKATAAVGPIIEYIVNEVCRNIRAISRKEPEIAVERYDATNYPTEQEGAAEPTMPTGLDVGAIGYSSVLVCAVVCGALKCLGYGSNIVDTRKRKYCNHFVVCAEIRTGAEYHKKCYKKIRCCHYAISVQKSDSPRPKY